MSDHVVIRTAEFDPRVRTYWLLSGALVLVITIFGIPLLLLWFPIGLWATGRYLDNMACVLTRKKLIVKKGILTRVENSVPLDKITDLTMVQGPLMRVFGLHQLKVETAGQSGAGSLVSLVGIVDAEAFREATLDQRDAFVERQSEKDSDAGPAPGGDVRVIALLEEISATLKRLENQG